MENEVFKSDEFRKKLYLSEFEFFDGDEFVKFNIVDINTGVICTAVLNGYVGAYYADDKYGVVTTYERAPR